MNSHEATTADEVAVCEWTGQVPRVSETLGAYGRDNTGYRGKWKVIEVRWLVQVDVLAPAWAHVVVEPACDDAAAWLDRTRKERARR